VKVLEAPEQPSFPSLRQLLLILGRKLLKKRLAVQASAKMKSPKSLLCNFVSLSAMTCTLWTSAWREKEVSHVMDILQKDLL